MDFKKINHLWHLADTFTVLQAAALIADFDPDSIAEGGKYFKNIETGITDSSGIRHFKTAFSILCNAINNGKLKATMRHGARLQQWDEYPNIDEGVRLLETVREGVIPPDVNDCIFFKKEPDWDKTTVEKGDLKKFLYDSGLRTGFFFPDGVSDTPGYLNPSHPRYSKKLAACIDAWEAMDDESKLKGTATKQALLEYLKKSDFLADVDGNVSASAAEDCATVANWNTKGGAPKTPG